MPVFIKSLNQIIRENINRKELDMYAAMNTKNIFDAIYLPIVSTKFWDNFLMRLIETAERKSKILDIGPGYGMFSLLLAEYGFNDISWLSYSKTMSMENTSIVNTEHTIMRYFGEIQNLEFNIEKKFDYIAFFEVLEHFKFNPVPTLIKISTWLSERGVVLLTTPSPTADKSGLYGSYKQLPDYNGEPIKLTKKNYLDISEGHQHIYSKTELIEIFELADLEIIEFCEVYGHHRVTLKRKNHFV